MPYKLGQQVFMSYRGAIVAFLKGGNPQAVQKRCFVRNYCPRGLTALKRLARLVCIQP